MKNTSIMEIIAILYIMLFLYTRLSKFMEYSVFRKQLAESPTLAPAAGLVARGLPVSEFVLATLIAVPQWRLKGLYDPDDCLFPLRNSAYDF